MDQQIPLYFSHIALGLYLIVLALGLTKSAENLAFIIVNRSTLRFFWLHTLWSLILFILLFQYAEHVWGLRCARNWNNIHMIALVVNPLIAFLAIEIHSPRSSSCSSSNLKEFYFQNNRAFFFTMAALPIANFFTDSFISQNWDIDHFEYFEMAFFISFVTLAICKSYKLHALLSVILLSFFILFSILFSSNYADEKTYERFNLCE